MSSTFSDGKFNYLTKQNRKIQKKEENRFISMKEDVHHVKSEVPPLKENVNKLEKHVNELNEKVDKLSDNVSEILRILSSPGPDVPDIGRFSNTLLLRDHDGYPPDPDECPYCKVHRPYCRKACFC